MPGSFSIDLSRFAVNSEKQMKLVIQKITMEAFERVVLKTPVDTGRARANWSPAIGAPTTASSPDKMDKSGGATIALAQKAAFDWNCIGSIFLCNNLPYIGALEYGSSRQAPAGMVRVTLGEISAHYGGR
jgi:hypothetical protein